MTTPETYLGSQRAARFVDGPLLPGRQDFGDPRPPGQDELAFHGTWSIAGAAATAAGRDAALELRFGARRVFLVLGVEGGSRVRTRRLRVLLDGRPLPDRLAGRDVRGGVAVIGPQRLYDLVDLGRVGDGVLRLEPEPGVSGYAFTFG